MAKAAGQIGMGGTQQSEEVSAGKNIYVLRRGLAMRSAGEGNESADPRGHASPPGRDDDVDGVAL